MQHTGAKKMAGRQAEKAVQFTIMHLTERAVMENVQCTVGAEHREEQKREIRKAYAIRQPNGSCCK